MQLHNQPERGTIFPWLRVVAVHEAYRLSSIERRDSHLDAIATVVSWEEVIADPAAIDDTLEAREALRVLAELPARQRDDLTLFIAGYSYREIAELTGGRTFTNVNKHLAKAARRSDSPGCVRRGQNSTAILFISEMRAAIAQPHAPAEPG